MPGYELIGKKENKELNNIFKNSNGVLFGHAFNDLRNNIFRVRDFEKNICKKLKVKYCVATTSGTMAQYVAMKALGIKENDEIITQAFTFVATVEAIMALRAKPIIINVDKSFNMCPEELKKKISKKTKLIIPVPMLGNPCDINQIKKIAKSKNVPLLEDACESLGSKYNNSFVGTQCDISVFSLDFGKTITTGEGGLIVTNKKKLYSFCKEFIDHGHQNDKRYPRGLDPKKIFGLNLRMTEMQAAVGIAQLKKLDAIIKKNRFNKRYLKSKIKKNINFEYRTINDPKELSDTLILILRNQKIAKQFVKYLNKNSFSTKNLPDAVDWHFAGKWGHIFKHVSLYKKKFHTEWKKTSDLLSKSVSIPIFVKSKKKELLNLANNINHFFDQISN